MFYSMFLKIYVLLTFELLHIFSYQWFMIFNFVIMKYERIHIGEKIREKVNDLGLSKMKFAQMINLQRQNIEKTVFSKNGLDTDLLVEIGEALEYDFFKYYQIEEDANKKDYIKPIRGKLSLEFGENKKEQVFKFEFGENNIEIFNK